MRRKRVVLAAGFLAGTALGIALPVGVHAQQKARFVPAGPGMARTIATDEPDSVPHTLSEALGAAYENNPQLTGERAHLRSVDENVPTALAGWRPTVTVTGQYGYAAGQFQTNDEPCTLAATTPGLKGCPKNAGFNVSSTSTGTLVTQNNRTEKIGQATITQYLYRGGKTTASTHEAVNSVYAERARLIAEEETVFTDTVNAYVTLIEDKQLLALDRANELVLGDELRAIDDRFKVGELTRTDVAQAEAALAAAIATRQTAEGNLATAQATFARQVGVQPPADLADPQPLQLPVKTETEASSLALDNNPNVIAAKFNESQQRDAVDVAFSQLAPNVSVQGSAFYQGGSALVTENSYGASALLNVTIPIYQGGQEYAAIRQARQSYLQSVRETEDAQRQARELAVQAWETLIAARASIASAKVAVRSSEIALEGLEREALVGSATTQEVLIGQQNLLTAQITLVQNVTSMVTASYGVASAIGRLTAADLGLQVPLYDETAYYKAVKNKLWGTGDHALNQPGR
jgi:outer membrane protein